MRGGSPTPHFLTTTYNAVILSNRSATEGAEGSGVASFAPLRFAIFPGPKFQSWAPMLCASVRANGIRCAHQEWNVGVTEMVMRKPDTEDLRKLHAEVNQLVGQRLTIATLAITIFGVMVTWIIPRDPATVGTDFGSFRYALTDLLILVEFALFLLVYYLGTMLRTITVYLDVVGDSAWEAAWTEYRKRFSYWGYTRPLSMIFIVLGILIGSLPIIFKIAFACSFRPWRGEITLFILLFAYVTFVIGMGLLKWFSAEGRLRERWQEIKHPDYRAIRVVSFDLEGTIVDLEVFHHKAHLRAAKDQGVHLSLESAIETIPHFIGGPDEVIADEIASVSHLPINPAKYLFAKRAYFKGFLENLQNIAPRPGFIQFLSRLQAQDVVIAIGTVSSREFANELLDRSGLRNQFPGLALIAREDVANPKPSADVYVKTAQICGCSCREQLVFEDSPGGVCAARASGSQVIGVPAVHSEVLFKRLISEGAEVVYPSWDAQELQSLSKSIGKKGKGRWASWIRLARNRAKEPNASKP